MAYTYAHDHVFDVPLARRIRRRRDVADVFRDRTHAELIDLEFSEYGRCARFLPGWYILPGIVAGVAVIVAVMLAV